MTEEKSLRITAQFEPFDAPETTITGVYRGHRYIPFPAADGGRLPQYLILTEQGFVIFNGTYNLNETLPGVPIGTRIRVTYKGDARTKNFKVKKFEVHVLGDDIDKVLAEFRAFGLESGDDARSLLPPRGPLNVNPETGEILPEEEEDSLPF